MSEIYDNNVKAINFGCRLNAYETDRMISMAQAQGLKNVVLINTCAVTQEAERQARQAIRKARRENPDAKIIVTGCAVQINAKRFEQMPEIDHILGNVEKTQQAYFEPNLIGRVHMQDIMQSHFEAPSDLHVNVKNARSFLEIQNGCDHRCTFCTIPFGRGNSRSTPMGVIVQRIHEVLQQGVKEIVFTGVDLTSYGHDLPGTPTLGQMLKRILQQIQQPFRLRLSSLDPAEVDDDLLNLWSSEPRMMPHVHISLQSADAMILKRMKRRHTPEHIVSFCAKMREKCPHVVFGADVIAGFPTETDEMFLNTLRILRSCNIMHLHVFPFSPRPNTPASRMPQVDRFIIKKRAKELRMLGVLLRRSFFEKYRNKILYVLLEKENGGYCQFYNWIQVNERQKIGCVVPVILKSMDDKRFYGDILHETSGQNNCNNLK